MENSNETPNTTSNKEDFYAVVSAIARFIETADNDLSPSQASIIREEVVNHGS